MALHFDTEEYANRLQRLVARMQEEKLDAMLLFAQESLYWLTGYDTFGFCFFQTLVVKADGSMVLLTRSADMRQARHTSNIEKVDIWVDRVNADPTLDLKNLLSDLDLLGCRIGVEYDTHGLTGRNARLLDNQLQTFGQIVDASYIVSRLRLIKSPAEVAYIEQAAALSDDALDAARPLIAAGGNEAAILAALQNTVLAGGGDYAANEFVIGSGPNALLVRSKSGRRTLETNDQLSLQWSGAVARYHAPMMRTVLIGEPTARHRELYSACRETIQAMEMVLRPGNTFGTIFETQARILDERGLARNRLNSCGYSVGARYAPSWMEHQQFHTGNPQEIEPNMSLFVHVILLDSETGTAMTLGQTYLTTTDTPRALSRYGLDSIEV